MADLPRRPFTLLPPPPGGSAGPRRRGRDRQRRQALVGGSATAVLVASLLGLGLTPSPSAVDRLDPDQFASPPATSTVTAEPSTAPTGAPEPSPAAQATGSPTASATAAATSPPSSDRPTPTPAAAEPEPQQTAAGPALRRSYQPPTGTAYVCGGSASSEVGGAPEARLGWCARVAVGPSSGDGRRDFTVHACRSSEAVAANLHVDAGAITLRIEQDGRVLWRLALPAEPAAVLRTEPGGCWSWRYAWDGVADNGAPLPSGQFTAVGRSLSDELRNTEEREDFTSGG